VKLSDEQFAELSALSLVSKLLSGFIAYLDKSGSR